jgi:pimeloyl-ACP methyl ester carboxylesterase
VERERIEIADGTSFACDHLAGPGPQIILLHAGVADRRAWRDVAAILNARGSDVTAYDRRGFGETPGTEREYDHVADLGAILDEIATEGPWLVGNSQGGRIALDLAAEQPHRVAGLVLIAPAVSGAPEIEDDELDPATREIAAKLEEAEDEGDGDLINELEARLWLDGPDGPEGRVAGPLRDLALAMNAVALVSPQPEDGGQGDHDAWSRLEEIETNTTVAWGELDIPAFVAQCRLLAERLPNAGNPVVLEGVAHLPGLERPDIVAELIAEVAGVEA